MTQNSNPKHKLHFKPKKQLKANEVFKLRIIAKAAERNLTREGASRIRRYHEGIEENAWLILPI
jgi:hypothetical protein